MDENIIKSLDKINKLQASMQLEFDNIAKVANDLFERSSLKNQLANDIYCEYSKYYGVILVLEMLDGESPHRIRIDDFFNLFIEDKLDWIKYRDIISNSICL